jgi:hypothetical protein
MGIKRKVRRVDQAGRVYRSRRPDGTEALAVPMLDNKGRLIRYILIDRRTPVPVHDTDEDVYLRVD